MMGFFGIMRRHFIARMVVLKFDPSNLATELVARDRYTRTEAGYTALPMIQMILYRLGSAVMV